VHRRAGPRRLLCRRLAACYAAAAQGVSVSADRPGQPPLRLVVSVDPKPPTDDPADPVAEVRGVNVHARQCVDGRDRRQLERLARYITRPPIAQHRLSLRPDGTLELELKSIWKDGTRAIVFSPEDLVVRLISAIPPPRWHMVRYFGILSSHSRLRKEVVPRPEPDPSALRPPPAEGDQLGLPDLDEGEEHAEPPRRNRWAWLLAHVFRADVETCARCGGPMRWVEAATTPKSAARLLAKLGLAPQPPPAPSPAPLGQLALPFGR
jgi:putative transposase